MVFRFLNIPVQIHPTFWIFLLLFTNIYRNPSIESVILGVILILSLLVHEYGHALTALYFGARPTITLEAFGGNAHYNSFGITPKREFLITLNGPLLQSFLILFSYLFLKSGVFTDYFYIQYFLHVTMRLNILLCLLNLIPLAPLDGGHLLRYVLTRKFGARGTRLSILIGLACMIPLAPYLYSQGFFFFGTLLLIFGFQNFQTLRQLKMVSGSNTPFSNYLKGVEAIKNNDLENGKTILRKLLKSKDNQIKHSAIESLAKVYMQENEPQKSYELLLKADPQFLKEGKCLLCKLAFDQKNYQPITQYAWDIYKIEPTYDIALMNSQAFAYLNEPDLAQAWQETAQLFDR